MVNCVGLMNEDGSRAQCGNWKHGMTHSGTLSHSVELNDVCFLAFTQPVQIMHVSKVVIAS